MIGQTWKSEIHEFRDGRTGRTVQQLTCIGNNVHLYFTENSFDAYKNEIIFRSDRASGLDRAPHEDPVYNLFRMNLDTGEIVQLTDETERISSSGNVTKTPDSRMVVYRAGNAFKKLDILTGEITMVYEETGRYTLGSPSISRNRRYMAFTRNEDVRVPRGPNYSGFKESYYRIKDGRITVAYLDGSGWFDAFKDTHWVSHFQFCPDDSTIGMYCREGPWNLVTQRIWLLDLASHQTHPCFRQDDLDSIGHEFWTQDSLIFFDNRGPGHDGTITSDRTQAASAMQSQDVVAYIKLPLPPDVELGRYAHTVCFGLGRTHQSLPRPPIGGWRSREMNRFHRTGHHSQFDGGRWVPVKVLHRLSVVGRRISFQRPPELLAVPS